MDPLSITTGILSLVGSGIKTIELCQSLGTKYSVADLTIISIRTECSSIRLALLQIQNIIEKDTGMRNLTAPEQLADEMWEEYTAAVDACSLTFNILSERLGKLELDKVDEHNATTIKAKIKAVMNSEEMACLVQNISGQAQALSLLLQVFQTATASRTQLLQQESTTVILQDMSDNTKSLTESLRTFLSCRAGRVLGDASHQMDLVSPLPEPQLAPYSWVSFASLLFETRVKSFNISRYPVYIDLNTPVPPYRKRKSKSESNSESKQKQQNSKSHSNPQPKPRNQAVHK